MFGVYKEVYYDNGLIEFEGSFKNDVPNGYGKLYFQTGELQYEGSFVNGVYDGEGTLYDENGDIVYSGKWDKGVKFTGVKGKTYTTDFSKVDQYMEELNSLIGLNGVKKELLNLINFVKLQKERQENGLKTPNVSLHMIFSGNPGTGKTTIARILSKIFYELGYLSKGHYVETNRSGLVAAYLGQTALKTEETVNKALGGVLFIDEAYSLLSDDDYSTEAIVTLLKLMEDYREDLVVIMAGYSELMKELLISNPGLHSRFNKHILFKDYSLNELMEIFQFMCDNASYKMDNEARESLLAYLEEVYENKDMNFGNARTIRNIFEQVIVFHANRVMSLEKVSKSDLMNIKKSDFLRTFNYMKENL